MKGQEKKTTHTHWGKGRVAKCKCEKRDISGEETKRKGGIWGWPQQRQRPNETEGGEINWWKEGERIVHFWMSALLCLSFRSQWFHLFNLVRPFPAVECECVFVRSLVCFVKHCCALLCEFVFGPAVAYSSNCRWVLLFFISCAARDWNAITQNSVVIQ